MKTISSILLGLALPLLVLAAEPARIERDLGQGLAYVRVHSLPADLPPTPAKPGPLVLDLRYARGNPDAATTLGAWLKFRTSARTPVFILVNGGTAPAVLEILETTEPMPGLLTLGAASSKYVPDVTLRISAAIERSAYDALEHGMPVETLLADNPTKPRHDEAAIAQDHAASATGSDDDEPALDDSSSPAPAAPPAPPPLIDAALQRAVQMHRALLALKRI
jgi:hypothetical protein